LRERFERGEIDIDPDDDKLAAQLGSIKWGIDSRGRIKIESKDDMRKRRPAITGPGRCDGHGVRWQGQRGAAEHRESRGRVHHRGLDDEGVVIGGNQPIRGSPDPTAISGYHR
jgi:hypothetical protein